MRIKTENGSERAPKHEAERVQRMNDYELLDAIRNGRRDVYAETEAATRGIWQAQDKTEAKRD